jgi:hypothetical protein
MTPIDWFNLATAATKVLAYIASMVLVVRSSHAWYKDDKQSAALFAVWAVLLGGAI